MDNPKVGAVVRSNLPQLLAYCETVDPEEIANLSDADYCNDVLGLRYPFFASPAEADFIATTTPQPKSRYWSAVYTVLDRQVRVTNHWYAKHLDPFVAYLADKGLTPVEVSPETVTAALNSATAPTAASAPKKGSSPGGARYKSTAIGNAQNAAVRSVLGSLGHESFTQNDWVAVKASFNFLCAYCSSPRQIGMDHAIPISLDALGEHRLGNLVPACRNCNADKGSKRYDDFLRAQRDRPDAHARIATIRDHMDRHGYRPLADTLNPAKAEEVRENLRQMRDAILTASTQAKDAVHDVIGL